MSGRTDGAAVAGATADEGSSPEEDVVDLAAAFEEAEIQDIFDRLDQDLVGLEQVKDRIREIAALLLVDRARRDLGLAAPPPTLHMSFTGNPGTGKTTVARRMAQVLHHLGYVREGHVVTVSRDDLVGQYIGHTAPKTKDAIKRAMGGVLFIDEAYYLYRPENERDYGQEAVEILLQTMEDDRDDLVVILAGYADKMDRFFRGSPGFRSRIGHHLSFPDYDQGELTDIADRMLAEQSYRLSDDGRTALSEYLERRMAQPQFANGRSVRNALDRARLRQAQRLLELKTASRDDLMTIDGPDIRASRVFDDPSEGSATIA